MNTFPRTLVSDGRGFCYRALRRVVPEPWLSIQGGVHSPMKGLVLVVVAHGTPLLKRNGFELRLASC